MTDTTQKPAASGFTLREATLDDLDAIARIYNSLWCNRYDTDATRDDWWLCGRFNIAMQMERSPITTVAEKDGEVVAACLVGIFDSGTPRKNETWEPTYQRLLAQATERAKTADQKLEGSLFGDSREKATADRFAATGSEYAQGQVNLIIIREKWQGLGLGRRLLDDARSRMRDAGCRKFFLMTDNHSDWQFYEHIGMTRIAEDHSQDTGDGFLVYVYGGDC